MTVWMLILIYLVLWDIRSEGRDERPQWHPKPRSHTWDAVDEARSQELKKRGPKFKRFNER